MSILDFFIKSRQPKPNTTAYFKLLSGYTPVFSTFNGGVYEMLLTRAAIHQIATQFSKLKMEVVGGDEKVQSLLRRPNQFHTPSQFLYHTATILLCDTNAFILPMIPDGNIEPVGIVSSVPQTVTAVEARDGSQWYQFLFNGQTFYIEASRIGVLRQYQYNNDLYGSGHKPLKSMLDVMQAQGEGLVRRIVDSAKLLYIGRLASQTSPDDIKAKRDEFASDNLSSKNDTALLVYDQTFAEVKQVEPQNYTVEAEQARLINENVYSYFGISEGVLKNTFNEEEWNAFYEGKIEPLAIQTSEVMSQMLGAEIMLTSNRMQYASNNTKVKVTQTLIDRGIITLNQALVDIWNMAPVEDGDVRVIRGEYILTDNLPAHTVAQINTNLPLGGTNADAD